MTEPLPMMVRDALAAACADSLLSFVEAVVRQVAHPLGMPAHEIDTPDARELAVAGALVPAIARAMAAGAPDDADAAALARDLPLLAACYQNLDLLPPEGDPVALLVAHALEQLAATPMAIAHD